MPTIKASQIAVPTSGAPLSEEAPFPAMGLDVCAARDEDDLSCREQIGGKSTAAVDDEATDRRCPIPSAIPQRQLFKQANAWAVQKKHHHAPHTSLSKSGKSRKDLSASLNGVDTAAVTRTRNNAIARAEARLYGGFQQRKNGKQASNHGAEGVREKGSRGKEPRDGTEISPSSAHMFTSPASTPSEGARLSRGPSLVIDEVSLPSMPALEALEFEAETPDTQRSSCTGGGGGGMNGGSHRYDNRDYRSVERVGTAKYASPKGVAGTSTSSTSLASRGNRRATSRGGGAVKFPEVGSGSAADEALWKAVLAGKEKKRSASRCTSVTSEGGLVWIRTPGRELFTSRSTTPSTARSNPNYMANSQNSKARGPLGAHPGWLQQVSQDYPSHPRTTHLLPQLVNGNGGGGGAAAMSPARQLSYPDDRRSADGTVHGYTQQQQQFSSKYTDDNFSRSVDEVLLKHGHSTSAIANRGAIAEREMAASSFTGQSARKSHSNSGVRKGTDGTVHGYMQQQHQLSSKYTDENLLRSVDEVLSKHGHTPNAVTSDSCISERETAASSFTGTGTRRSDYNADDRRRFASSGTAVGHSGKRSGSHRSESEHRYDDYGEGNGERFDLERRSRDASVLRDAAKSAQKNSSYLGSNAGSGSSARYYSRFLPSPPPDAQEMGREVAYEAGTGTTYTPSAYTGSTTAAMSRSQMQQQTPILSPSRASEHEDGRQVQQVVSAEYFCPLIERNGVSVVSRLSRDVEDFGDGGDADETDAIAEERAAASRKKKAKKPSKERHRDKENDWHDSARAENGNGSGSYQRYSHTQLDVISPRTQHQSPPRQHRVKKQPAPARNSRWQLELQSVYGFGDGALPDKYDRAGSRLAKASPKQRQRNKTPELRANARNGGRPLQSEGRKTHKRKQAPRSSSRSMLEAAVAAFEADRYGHILTRHGFWGEGEQRY